jgi:hypothetical protein
MPLMGAQHMLGSRPALVDSRAVSQGVRSSARRPAAPRSGRRR